MIKDWHKCVVIWNTQRLTCKIRLWGEVYLASQQLAIFQILQGLTNALLYPGGAPLKSNDTSLTHVRVCEIVLYRLRDLIPCCVKVGWVRRGTKEKGREGIADPVESQVAVQLNTTFLSWVRMCCGTGWTLWLCLNVWLRRSLHVCCDVISNCIH